MPPSADRASRFGSSFELNLSNHSHHSPQHCQKQQHDECPDYKAKNALDGMVGSLQAVLDFLAHNGVSPASVEELRKGIESADYLYVLNRAQEYAKCLTECCDAADLTAMVFLLVSSWQSLYRYADIQYKKAFRQFHGSRRRHHHAKTAAAASQQQAFPVDLAELTCHAQRGLILALRWEERLEQQQ